MMCPKCKKPLHVQNTRIRGNKRIQYMACNGCKYRPRNNKIVRTLSVIISAHK